MMSRSNYLLSDNLKLGEFQQQLLGTRIFEADGSFQVVARALDALHDASPETLVQHLLARRKVAWGSICGRSRCRFGYARKPGKVGHSG